MKKISIKLWKNIKTFLLKIKPKSSKNYSKKSIDSIWNIIFGLIKGQKCFLNTIVQNMEHYKDSLDNFKNGKRKKILSKNPQVAKISENLNIDITKFKEKFLKYILWNINFKSFDELKNKSIKERIFEQWLILHDTTDIQKPFAKKMEKIAQARDWSTHKPWKWYYAEGTILFLKWRIQPLLLTLFSWKDETDAKKITRKNINFIKPFLDYKKIINVFDRGYDVASFIKKMIEKGESFIIRGVKNRWIICPKYYEKIKWKWITKIDRQNIFSKVKDFTKEMNFKEIATHKHYSIAFKEVLKKWENADKDLNDVISLNLIVIRLRKNSNILWIEEDLKTFKNSWEYFDKEFYFYTNLNIETPEDALVVFYLYLKRWKIEVYFKYLKQVFDLEKLKILKLKKLENICNLLVFASYYLYEKYYNVLKKFDTLEKGSLENILIEEWKDKNNLELLILKYYFQYCEQLNLKFTADSFAKFINFEIWNEVIYCEKIFFESW